MGTDQIQIAAVRRPLRAFTMVELLLAIAITGMVSVAVATMLVAVAYGTSSDLDLRSVVVTGKVVNGRVDSAIRASRAILEIGTDYLVLWTGDTNPNGASDAPDLAELRLIERDNGTNELRSYAFSESWSQAQIDAANASYALAGNAAGFFQTATAAAKTAGSFQPTKWASGVTAAQFSVDGADPVTNRLVSYQLTLGVGDLSEVVVGATSIRYGAVNPS